MSEKGLMEKNFNPAGDIMGELYPGWGEEQEGRSDEEEGDPRLEGGVVGEADGRLQL